MLKSVEDDRRLVFLHNYIGSRRRTYLQSVKLTSNVWDEIRENGLWASQLQQTIRLEHCHVFILT